MRRGRGYVEDAQGFAERTKFLIQNSSPSTPRSASVTRLPRVLFLRAGGGDGAGTSPRSRHAWYSGFITCASHRSLIPQDTREGWAGPAAHLHGEHDAVAVAVVLDRVEVPTPGNFYVNSPPLFLGHFSPILLVLSPFFRRSPHLAANIQETSTKTRKNGPKRSKNGREKTPS